MYLCYYDECKCSGNCNERVNEESKKKIDADFLLFPPYLFLQRILCKQNFWLFQLVFSGRHCCCCCSACSLLFVDTKVYIFLFNFFHSFLFVSHVHVFIFKLKMAIEQAAVLSITLFYYQSVPQYIVKDRRQNEK